MAKVIDQKPEEEKAEERPGEPIGKLKPDPRLESYLERGLKPGQKRPSK